MEADATHLYRWTLPVPAHDALPARLRRMEAMVTRQAGPFLRDPVVREHASAYWLRKRPGDEAGEGCGVEVSVVAPSGAESGLTVALGRHVFSEARPELELPESDLIVLHPIAEEYRLGLREATEIALDLHLCSGEELRRHQCALIRIGCSAEDPRFSLHAYLMEESPAYVALSSWSQDSRDLWRHESFWVRMFTPGPALEHPRPLLLLWNIVVGLTPRRWRDPRVIAESIGIGCS